LLFSLVSHRLHRDHHPSPTRRSSDLEAETTADPDAETIRIGALHPLTGGLADDGSAMNAAVQMAIDDINEAGGIQSLGGAQLELDRKSTRLNSSHVKISYAVFCLKKK